MGETRDGAEPADASPRDAPDRIVAGEDGEPQLGGHVHAIAHPSRWPWLERQDEQGLDRHPFCPDCGLVKHVGRDRPLKPGTLVNVLARLRKQVRRDGRRITDAQKRLILQDLRDREADDPFGLDRPHQLEILEEVLAERTGFEPVYVHQALHAVLDPSP